MNKNKYLKYNMWTALIIIITIIYSIPVLSLCHHKQNSFSYYENRMLAIFPALSIDSIKDGMFFEECEKYMIDHIYKRDKWMHIYTSMQINALKKPVVNDVVVTDGLLLTPIKPIPAFKAYNDMGIRAAKDLVKLKNKAKEVGGKLVVVGIPEQYSIMRDRYPYPLFNNNVNLTTIEETFFHHISQAGIEAVNMRPYFETSGDNTFLYAKTDHHYRLEGAYLAYTVLCEKLHEMGFEFPVTTKDDFDYIQLPNSFLGSRARKLYGLSPVKENMLIYKLKEEIPFTRYDNGELVDSSVFSLPSSYNDHAEYLVYMGGDVPETIIQTNRPNLPNVLLFGNSYTNALETFLYTSFNETRSLDLRYYKEKGILEYIDGYRPDIIICMRYDLEYLLQSGNGVIE